MVALKLSGDPVQEGDGLTAQRSRRRGSGDTMNTTLLKNSRDMLTGSTLMNGMTMLLLLLLLTLMMLFMLKMLSMLKRGRERKERDRNRGRSARTTRGQIARTNTDDRGIAPCKADRGSKEEGRRKGGGEATR